MCELLCNAWNLEQIDRGLCMPYYIKRNIKQWKAKLTGKYLRNRLESSCNGPASGGTNFHGVNQTKRQ